EIAEKMPIYRPEEIDEQYESVDLLIVFTKSMQLENMSNSMKPVISNDTYVLCLHNGLCHEDVLERFVTRDHIIMGVTMWASMMTAPGHITFANDNGNVEIQCLDPKGKNETKEIVKILSDAGLNASYSEKVMYSIWRKAYVNGVVNALCALLGANCKEFGHTKEADELTRNIVQEFADDAQYERIYLDRSQIIQHIESLFDTPHYPTNYQNQVQNNRQTEIDYIDRDVWRKGLKHSVPTPYCAFMTR